MKTLFSLLLSISMALPVSAAQPETDDCVKLPVFMYHRILMHPTTKDPYTISPEAFEDDLIFLRDNGYTTVGTDELLAFSERGEPLPEKPVVLTFDDGHFNNIYYAAPLLDKYNMKAVIFIVGKFSDVSSSDNIENPNYSYITWERMENLPVSIEIQNHTWDMHRNKSARKGIKRKSGESKAEYEQALAEDLKKLNEKIELHTGKKPVAFAIPFGAEEEWSYPVLKSQGLTMCFCSQEGVSVIKRSDPETLSHVKRMVRSPTKSPAVLLKKYA